MKLILPSLNSTRSTTPLLSRSTEARKKRAHVQFLKIKHKKFNSQWIPRFSLQFFLRKSNDCKLFSWIDINDWELEIQHRIYYFMKNLLPCWGTRLLYSVTTIDNIPLTVWFDIFTIYSVVTDNNDDLIYSVSIHWQQRSEILRIYPHHFLIIFWFLLIFNFLIFW